MERLTLENILKSIEPALAALLPRQLANGEVIEPTSGVADPLGSMRMFISWLGLAVIADAKYSGQVTLPEPAGRLIERATAATEALIRLQRPSGCIDLIGRDYDTGPSAAFAVQAMATVLELGRDARPADPAWRGLLSAIERFIRKAVAGIIERGFHTPNHRWVVASALAQAGRAMPDLVVKPTIDAYLAEGIDINAEGAWTERSAGIYDAISNVAMLLLAEQYEAPGALDAVRANLAMNLSMLNPDGSVETGLSHRQDYGTRSYPIELGATYYWLHQLQPTPDFATAASLLWGRGDPTRRFWHVYVALRHAHRHATPSGKINDASRYFPATGFWSIHRGQLAAGVFQSTSRIMGLQFGDAELSALKIFNAYMGTGKFVGDEMTVTGDTATLKCHGASPQFGLPGSWKPLGRRLDVDNAGFWSKAVLSQRELVPMDKWTGELTIESVADGFDCRVVMHTPYDRVLGQITFDFPPGGVWETDDCATDTRAGQILFLKKGYGTMRYGNDVIRIGPGNEAHRAWKARDSELATGLVRVIVPLWCPAEYAFSIRYARGWERD